MGILILFFLMFSLVIFEKELVFLNGFLFVATGAFHHGDLGHLLGNLIFLFALGNYFSSRIGWWRYLLFVFAVGLVCNLLTTGIRGENVIGISGVVWALLGTLLVTEPKLQLQCSYWVLVKWGKTLFTLPLAVGFWALGEVIALVLYQGQFIAHEGHLAGFVIGLIIGMVIRYRSKQSPQVDKRKNDCKER
ncbi:MAG: rhomboid family intramembrane serine protease [Opitutales bacterium]|nr:rhomboid family intramembrane serine protease [Opitutales bacterium]